MTWDMGKSMEDEGAYDYFNLADERIVKDHRVGYKLPECSFEKKS